MATTCFPPVVLRGMANTGAGWKVGVGRWGLVMENDNHSFPTPVLRKCQKLVGGGGWKMTTVLFAHRRLHEWIQKNSSSVLSSL